MTIDEEIRDLAVGLYNDIDWLAAPSRGQPFDGRSPADLMAVGDSVLALRYLRAKATGFGPPLIDDPEFEATVYSDDDIRIHE
jgi:hypothetical protein